MRLRLRRHRGDDRRGPAGAPDADVRARRRVVRRAQRADRPPLARIDGPRGRARRGRGRRGGDPAPGARAARLRPGPDELRGAAPGGGDRRGGRGGARPRGRRRGRPRLPGARLEHGHVRRDPRPRRARRRLAGGPGRRRIRGCRAACDWTSRPLVRRRSTRRTATAEQADAFIELDPALDFEALWALRALVGRRPLDRDRARSCRSTASSSSRSACSPRATSRCSTATARRRGRRAGAVRARARPEPRPARGHAGTARARATRAAPRTSSPGRPASPRR